MEVTSDARPLQLSLSEFSILAYLNPKLLLPLSKCSAYSDKPIITELNRIANSRRDVADEDIYMTIPKSEVEAWAVRHATIALRSSTKRDCVRTLIKKESYKFK